jgi:hypothetical protein
MPSALELAEIVVDLTRQIATTRRERERWRTLAIESIEQYSALAREREIAGDVLVRRIERRLLDERDGLLAPAPRRRTEAA